MEIFIDFIIFCLQVVFYSIVFNFIIRILFSGREKEEAAREELAEQVASLLHFIDTETRNGIHYWFDKETGQFLAQGQTDEEIRNHLLGRFNGHVFLIDDTKAMAGPELKICSIESIVLKNGKLLDRTSLN